MKSSEVVAVRAVAKNGGVMRVSWEGKWPPTEVQRRTLERLISVRRAPYDYERTKDFG